MAMWLASPHRSIQIDYRQTYFQKRPFVHKSVCSQFLEGLFVILAECSQLCLRSFFEIQEEIHHFAGWEGGVEGHKNCEQKFCEQTGVSYIC